ncbi:hypothetical protein HAX54_001632 [Datura stramonium]|uniref:Uncharacterized protein n=1 Tax=Datura stramonium TaxID=4076 RepID=A0ABS8T4W1_DATST|nr:hypothetical protein [Datura stramonium]
MQRDGRTVKKKFPPTLVSLDQARGREAWAWLRVETDAELHELNVLLIHCFVPLSHESHSLKHVSYIFNIVITPLTGG